MTFKPSLAWLSCVLIPAYGAAQALPTVTSAPTEAPVHLSEEKLRRFNQDDFVLAFDVLVGNAQLDRAFLVAQQAVRELPRDQAWRRRLAKVAEWLGRDDTAAEQWQALFLQGNRAQDTLDSLRRLAPALGDPTIALQAWAYIAQHGELSDAQWDAINQLYETIGEPAQGSRFFEAQYRQNRNLRLLELAARLAVNAGDDRRAEQLYRERLQLTPFSLDALLSVVLSLINHDQTREALELLKTHADKVPDDATDFWRLLGQLAWDLNEFNNAEPAYRRAAQSRHALLIDWSRLTFLARQREPRAAAELALQAHQRFDALDQLMLALAIYVELGDSAALKRIYLGLNAEQRERAEQSVTFLLDRSRFWQGQGQPDLAWADLKHAGRMSPQDDAIALATLWFLIDYQRSADLSTALERYRSAALGNPAYWPPMAAAYQVTGQYRLAAEWFRMALRRTPDDALLLLNYADALEQLGSTGMADRVRRQAWHLVKNTKPTPEDLKHLSNKPELLARVRLELRDQRGDPAMQWVRQLANQLRDGAIESADQDELDSLILGWVILQEQYANARSWIGRRYGPQSRKAVPLWVDTLLAEQVNDRQRMDRLLKTHGKTIPATSRYDMALAMDYVDQALTSAFQGMDKDNGEQSMHDRFRQLAPQQSNYVQVRAFSESLDAMNQQGVEFKGRWVVNPNFHLLLGWTKISQSSSDPEFDSLLPPDDRLDNIELRWLGPQRETRLAVTQRTELQSVTGLRLHQTGRLAPRIDYEAGIDYRTESLLSLPLRAAGYESGLYAGFTYNVSKRDYLRFEPRFNRYYTQYDDYLGSGRIVELEAGHHLSANYPDWRVRVYLLDQSFTYDGQISAANLARLPAFLQTGIAAGNINAATYMIPESSTTYAACATMGENVSGQQLQSTYSRAWRPFMDACLTSNTITGDGYTASLGVAGAVVGSDHMRLQWEGSEGSAPGTSSMRIFSITYRHYF